MPDPYNITQVDIPGIYAAVNQNRMGRIQAMLGQQQLQNAQLQAERDNSIRGILAKAYGGAHAAQTFPSPSAPAAGATSTPTSTSTPAAGATAAPSPAPMAPVGATPAVTPPGLPGADPAGTPSMRVPPELAQQLLAQGPEGQAMLHSINQMSDEQLSSAQHRLQALAPLYAQMAHIPYGTDGSARRAFIRSVIPEIQSMGIDPQQAIGWDPTDQALNAHMSFGQTTSEALESARGHPMNVAPGNVTIDTDTIDPATGQPRVIYQSPFVPGPNGAVYPRPQQMDLTLPHPRTQQERDALPPGQAYIAPDGSVHTIPGGPASAPATFPRQDGGAFDFGQHP